MRQALFDNQKDEHVLPNSPQGVVWVTSNISKWVQNIEIVKKCWVGQRNVLLDF